MTPTATSPVQPRILGRLLVDRGALTAPELERALAEQRGSGRRLGELLVDTGRVDAETVARSLADQLGLRYRPPPLRPQAEALQLVRAALARDRLAIPLSLAPRTLVLAMADPLDAATLDDVRFQSGRRVEVVVASRAAVADAIARGYGDAVSALVDALPESPRSADDRDALEEVARAAPVVQLLDHLLRRAVAERASDVHVEERSDAIRVRFRIDGVLRDAAELPPRAGRPLVSRLKVVAGMDISVRRRPQDGGFSLRQGSRGLSLRVSTLPVPGGEKAVLRILDPERAPPDLPALGLGDDDLRKLRAMIAAGQGVVLAAGPTGSGKSSTLRSVLLEIDRDTRNVVTLEDPIEYRIPAATQVQVDPKAGLGFAAALRSVLRQDPDVIMVGEIRDRETAEIAMAAAVTGHLVLSTVHTTDAPGAVTRLLEMGVPSYLVAGGLAGVVAQRLVRRRCAACAGPAGHGGGDCPRCHDGYRGRVGVFQILALDDAIRDAIVRSGKEVGGAGLHRLAREGGMASMAEDARRKVAEGLTTPHEVGRVLRGDGAASPGCQGCGDAVPSGADGCPACGRARVRRCMCGRSVRPGWRYCAWCLRRL